MQDCRKYSNLARMTHSRSDRNKRAFLAEQKGIVRAASQRLALPPLIIPVDNGWLFKSSVEFAPPSRQGREGGAWT
jgi:hypothetical protein